MRAYVLVQTQPGNGSIAATLQTVPGVDFAHDLRGPYDAIALARSDSIRRAIESIVAEIRKLPGVVRAVAAPVNHPHEEARSDAAA
ncbi:MAG: Lrp/AsnC ligand binding domain-containing protein [Actinomycetota bacterium]